MDVRDNIPFWTMAVSILLFMPGCRWFDKEVVYVPELIPLNCPIPASCPAPSREPEPSAKALDLPADAYICGMFDDGSPDFYFVDPEQSKLPTGSLWFFQADELPVLMSNREQFAAWAECEIKRAAFVYECVKRTQSAASDPE